jgi:hypothetical protein
VCRNGSYSRTGPLVPRLFTLMGNIAICLSGRDFLLYFTLYTFISGIYCPLCPGALKVLRGIVLGEGADTVMFIEVINDISTRTCIFEGGGICRDNKIIYYVLSSILG